jgi:hypothetical protein
MTVQDAGTMHIWLHVVDMPQVSTQPALQVTLQSEDAAPQFVWQPPPHDTMLHVALAAVQSELHPPTQFVTV